MNDKKTTPGSPKWCNNPKNDVYTRRYNKSALKAPIVHKMHLALIDIDNLHPNYKFIEELLAEIKELENS